MTSEKRKCYINKLVSHRPYTVRLLPADRPPISVTTETLCTALCLVAWAVSKAEVFEYETRIDLRVYRAIIKYISDSQDADRRAVLKRSKCGTHRR